MIQEQVEKLKAIVNQNDMGHLSLPYRVDLMKQIGSTRVVQKILCECCKKVYPLWENMSGMETPLYKILSDADEYLYKGKGSVKAILASVEKWRNYAEQATDEAEAMAGWAIIALGYAIRYDAASILNIEEYCGEDDNAFDYEGWNVDFICSIAYSGGNPFIRDAGDVEKRREYWFWYLDMVLAMYENPDKPYLAITAKKQSAVTTVMPARTQSCSLATIKSQINQIIDLLLNSTTEYAVYDELEICFASLGAYLIEFYYLKDGIKHEIDLDIELESNPNLEVSEVICEYFANIQKEMYKQNPKEGAWMQCRMIIKRDKMYHITFNYDDINSVSEIFHKPDWLLSMFEEYPRSKEYTPQWYRDIIGKRKLYLS